MPEQEDYNLKVIKEQGGTRYDPSHPEHLKYRMENGTNQDRFVAGVEFHTLSFGHKTDGFGPYSPWAVDEHGHTMKLKDFAKLFGWHIENARKEKDDAIRSGRIREDEHGRFWMCGKIGSQTRTAKEKKEQRDMVSTWPAPIRARFASLSKAEQEAAIERYSASERTCDAATADTLAEIRHMRSEVHNNIFRTIDPDYNPKVKPNGRSSSVSLALVNIPDILLPFMPKRTNGEQGGRTQGETSNLYSTGKNGVYTPKLNGASLLPSTATEEANILLVEKHSPDLRREEVGRCVGAQSAGDKNGKSAEPTYLPAPSLHSQESRYDSMKKYLRGFVDHVHRAPTHLEIAKTTRELGPASFEQFKARVEFRQDHGLKITGYGLFVGIAEECAKSAEDWTGATIERKPARGEHKSRLEEMLDKAARAGD